MNIGNQNIITPMEDPIGYAPDWRSRIARILVAAHIPYPVELGLDMMLRTCRRYLQILAHNFRPVHRGECECIRRVLA